MPSHGAASWWFPSLHLRVHCDADTIIDDPEGGTTYDLNPSKRTGLLSILAVLIPAVLLGITLWATGVRTVRADPDVIYVDGDAPGPTYDGASWTTAYTNVQDALLDAEHGDEIWVAQGVYYPDEGAGQTNDVRISTFRLRPGVAL